MVDMNDENIEKLVKAMFDNMDSWTIYDIVLDHLKDGYWNSDERFQEDWKATFGDKESNE